MYSCRILSSRAADLALTLNIVFRIVSTSVIIIISEPRLITDLKRSTLMCVCVCVCIAGSCSFRHLHQYSSHMYTENYSHYWEIVLYASVCKYRQ